jgi:hypothetical protein
MQLTTKRTIGLVFAFVPTGLVVAQTALWYALVWRARVALGRWPRAYNDPQPGGLGLTLHDDAVVFGALLALLAPVLWAGVALFVRRWNVSGRELAASGASLFVACAISAALALIDPGSFSAWYFD